MSLSAYWIEEVRKAMGMDIEVWNPFASFEVLPGAIPAELKGQEPRFAAAVGAAVGAMNRP
jgi:hypothetical protein